MKFPRLFLLALLVSLILTNCSNDDESLEIVTQHPRPTQQETLPTSQDALPTPQEVLPIPPLEPLATIGAIAIAGYPKTIKKFEYGILNYWSHYYFKPDGNLLKVTYGHPLSTTELFTNTYHYNAEGKIIKITGWDDFDFFWENNRVMKVEAYNDAWNGRYHMLYDYNNQGQIIKKTTAWFDFTPVGYDETTYIYFSDGNLKSIEYYGDYNGSSTIVLYSETYFEGYIESRNLFLDHEIIPGQRELHQFPGSKKFRDLYESTYVNQIYTYNYDTQGRVIEKKYGTFKIVYDYY